MAANPMYCKVGIRYQSTIDANRKQKYKVSSNAKLEFVFSRKNNWSDRIFIVSILSAFANDFVCFAPTRRELCLFVLLLIHHSSLITSTGQLCRSCIERKASQTDLMWCFLHLQCSYLL